MKSFGKKYKNESHAAANRISGKPTYQLSAAHAVAQNAPAGKANRTGLPDHLKNGAEHLSGISLDDVKVYYNSNKPAQLRAHAYAQGNEIHLAPGQERHLPHEAWHVAQQKKGRVQATFSIHGAKINDDAALEKDADVMGAKSASTGKALQAKFSPERHSSGCGCQACAGKIQSPGETSTPFRGAGSNSTGIIQGCFYCGDPTCLKGEKCKTGSSFSGLFPSGSDSMDVGYYNQIKKEGSQGKTRQWEHPISGSAMRQSGMGSYYSKSPVVGIPWDLHQDGRYGMGEGISTTGNSFTAQNWSGGMAKSIQSGNTKEAVRMGMIDAINAAQSQGLLSLDWAHAYMRVINGYKMDNQISGTDAGELQNELMAIVLDRLEKPRF